MLKIGQKRCKNGRGGYETDCLGQPGSRAARAAAALLAAFYNLGANLITVPRLMSDAANGEKCEWLLLLPAAGMHFGPQPHA